MHKFKISCASYDLCSLAIARWIATSYSRMQVNIGKTSVMWFSVRSSKTSIATPTIFLEGMNVSKQKYLGIIIDSNLIWVHHVAHVCKKMAYYLYLIGYYQKVLPDSVIKMLIDSLVASHLVYALSVWGPSLSVGLFHRSYYSVT